MMEKFLLFLWYCDLTKDALKECDSVWYRQTELYQVTHV